MRKALSILLILAGLGIATYPPLSRAYSWHMQKKLLAEWEAHLEPVAPSQESETGFRALEEVFLREQEPEEVEPEPEQEPEPVTPPAPKPLPKPTGKTLGVIEIPKIKVKLPIFYGTSMGNLIVGAGQIEGTTAIGEIGNVAISAHRSYTYGHQFNRLDELKEGDEISITTDTGSYVYKVYKTLVVEPTDTSVLNRNNRDKVLTLVTCTPIQNATHRLIVHAVQISP